MPLFAMMLAGVLISASMTATSDPLVGTWVYNAGKSPKPTIRYAIKDLGGERYALTGSTGETTEIKADGESIKSPSGATVSFKKVDNYNWVMARTDAEKMVRTYTVSADDKTLTLHDAFSGDKGSTHELITRYARLAPGHSIFGEWQSVSMEEKGTGEKQELIIEAFGSDGLSFIVPHLKHRVDMNFDGKRYSDIGDGDSKGQTSSGKRISDRAIVIDGQVNDKPDDREEFTVSEDGKTLTIVTRPAGSTAVFTSVWDRQ